MVFYSQAWQDEFVIRMLNFKKNGHFIDIGSGDGINQSNSYFFESEMGWKGICVERGAHCMGWKDLHAKDASRYVPRNNSLFLNSDATQVDYKALLDGNKYPTRIEYLSVDIDENSSGAICKIPFSHYRFSVITAEHDAYRLGNKLKEEERKFIEQHNYMLLFPDVLVPLGCGMGPNLPFEDWWIDPTVFNMEKVAAWGRSRSYPDDIVAALRSQNTADLYRG